MYRSANFLCLISIEKNKDPYLISVLSIDPKEKEFVSSIVSEDMGSACEDLLCFNNWQSRKWSESKHFINDAGIFIAYSSCWSDYNSFDREGDCGINQIKSIRKAASFDEINLFYQEYSVREQDIKAVELNLLEIVNA